MPSVMTQQVCIGMAKRTALEIKDETVNHGFPQCSTTPATSRFQQRTKNRNTRRDEKTQDQKLDISDGTKTNGNNHEHHEAAANYGQTETQQFAWPTQSKQSDA